MSVTLLDLTERLVPISDFSQGKAGKIFNDVAENNNEYIVLKNNQPTAVLLSVKEYRETQEKVAKLEEILEKVENIRLLKLAESRAKDSTSSFESFVNEQGFSIEELEKISESVEFEFNGQKSAEDVAKIIQNRARNYVSENYSREQ